MKLAILKRQNEPISLEVFLSNTISKLSKSDIEIQYFSERSGIPVDCDLVWEPALAMRRIPKVYRSCKVPIVATIHGVKAYSLPLHEITSNMFQRWHQIWLKKQLSKDWEWFKEKVFTVVAVSQYGALEVKNAFNLPEEKIQFIYNAIDQSLFNLNVVAYPSVKSYFFNVSGNNPIKNIKRIIKAYSLIPCPKPNLIIVMPGYKERIKLNGIHIINNVISQSELAQWYRGAIALVFPSLRETFGMPILEAMACGCPVITSNITGCAEISDNNALLVNPRSTLEIRNAMVELYTNSNLRENLIQRGLIHANNFTWEKSTNQLYNLFTNVIAENKKI